MASEIPRITPNALRTPTTSFAIVEIHAIETTKPRKHNRKRYFGAFNGDVVRIRIANATSEPSRDQRTIWVRKRPVAPSVLAQTIITTNRGAVKICTTTSHLFQSPFEGVEWEGGMIGRDSVVLVLCLAS
jgi:hypothetical protein